MVNVSIVENDLNTRKKIKNLLKHFLLNCDIDRYININEYSFVAADEINWGEYCFVDTEFPCVEDVVGKVKNKNKYAKIVFVGECDNTKNIDFAVRGFSLGISGYILKTYTDAEIMKVFAYVFKPFSYT